MSEQTIRCVDDADLINFIQSAKTRLVFAGPGLRHKVADALVERWKSLGPERVDVILDVDPEVVRLGYGEFEAIQRLQTVAGELGANINRQVGIRIGLVVADERILIFSPTPFLIESTPREQSRPSAILLNSVPPAVNRDLGQGENGTRDRQIGMDAVKRRNYRRRTLISSLTRQ
ncbi:MAG: hypothetical protein M1132_01545 [Chloroflexi bacterium]|nr:hypothetical protein [Chloroflexota bacterium]